MKDRILLQTNLWVCLVIIVGFLMTALLGYQANYSASIESPHLPPRGYTIRLILYFLSL